MALIASPIKAIDGLIINRLPSSTTLKGCTVANVDGQTLVMTPKGALYATGYLARKHDTIGVCSGWGHIGHQAGRALVRLGFITQEVLDAAIAAQRKRAKAEEAKSALEKRYGQVAELRAMGVKVPKSVIDQLKKLAKS